MGRRRGCSFAAQFAHSTSHSVSCSSFLLSSHRPVRCSNPISASKGGRNVIFTMGRAIAIALWAGLFAAPAFAQMTCAALGGYLATQPNISQFVPPTPPNAARCEAKFIYSARGGPADGYAVGQSQRIGIVVGFPLNSFDGGSGAVQGAWNGKVRNIGGGGLQGNLSSITAATNTGYVGSNTDTGHPTGSPAFADVAN